MWWLSYGLVIGVFAGQFTLSDMTSEWTEY